MHHSSVSVEQKHVWMAFRQWSIAVIICGLCFGVDRVGGLVWFRGGFEQGLLKIDTRIVSMGAWFKQPIKWWTQSKNKTERLANLEERLAHAAVEQQKLKDMSLRLELLEPMVIAGNTGQKATQIAQLVDYGDRVMLALGDSSGVQTGQMMTDKEGVLVGQISRIGRYMSEVQLLDEVGSRVQVQTVKGTTKGIVEGNGGNATLVGVLQSELLVSGDILVTTGTDGIYPPGLVVGQVTVLQGKPEDVTKGGIVELLAERTGWVALW
jgi:rod shape-determining protein MreC